MRFLDTNILLRHLTGDDAQKAQACYRLLQRVERGEEVVAVSDMVIAETVFVLQSPRHYGLPRERIRRLIEPLLELRGIRLAGKSSYRRAFDLFCDKGIDFADAHNAAYMEAQGMTEVYSYDADFDRVEGIRRLEPEA